MKSLRNLSLQEQFDIIIKNSELKSMLEDAVLESENNFISDKLRCFDDNAIDYSICAYSKNYMLVIKAFDTLLGIEKSISTFGGSDTLVKKVEACNKLYKTDSNLFEYNVKLLLELYYYTEIKTTIDYIEEISCKFYSNDVKFEDVCDYIDCLNLDGYFIESGKLLKVI